MNQEIEYRTCWRCGVDFDAAGLASSEPCEDCREVIYRLELPPAQAHNVIIQTTKEEIDRLVQLRQDLESEKDAIVAKQVELRKRLKIVKQEITETIEETKFQRHVKVEATKERRAYRTKEVERLNKGGHYDTTIGAELGLTPQHVGRIRKDLNLRPVYAYDKHLWKDQAAQLAHVRTMVQYRKVSVRGKKIELPQKNGWIH